MNGRLALVALLAGVLALVAWLARALGPEARGSRQAPDGPSPSFENPRGSDERPVELATPTPAAPGLSVPVEGAPARNELLSAAALTPSEPSILLYGFVRPPPRRGALLSTPWIVLVDSFAETTRGQASEDGAYSLAGLRPGRYWLHAGSDQDGERRAIVDLDGTQAQVRFDIELAPRAELLVKVVDASGQPAPLALGLTAVATVQPPGRWLPEIVAGNNPVGVGRFHYTITNGLDLPPEYLGRLRLDVAPPVFVSLVRFQRVVATAAVAEGATEVEFVIDSGSPLLGPTSLRCRLVARSTRAPLAGASASFVSYGLMGASADAEGVIRLAKCLPGWHVLRIQAKGYERGEFRLLAEAGIENDFGDLELEQEQWVAGVVVDEQGLAVRSTLECEWIDPATRRVPLTIMHWLERTAADGSFRITGLSRGLYRLTLDREGPWGAAAWEVDTRQGPVEDLRLRVARGVPLVLHPSSAETPGLAVEIFDASGTSLVTRSRISPEPLAIQLAPGRYELEVRPAGQPAARKAFSIESAPVVIPIP
jgi:hypothetical protein